MKKFLLSLGCLVAMTVSSFASDVYKLVTNVEDLTENGVYLLAAPYPKNTHYYVMSCEVGNPDKTNPYMSAVKVDKEIGDEIIIPDGNPDNYALLQIPKSTRAGHEGHRYFYVTNKEYDGYLTDQPATENSLSVHNDEIANLDALNTYHLKVAIAETGEATLHFYDGGKSIIQLNTSTNPVRFAAYDSEPEDNSFGQAPRIFKRLGMEGSEEVTVTTPIENTTEVDINSSVVLFEISNESVTDDMMNAIEITVGEDVDESSYTITKENGIISVVLNEVGVYSFTASIDPTNENFWMIPVTAATLNVVDPAQKPDAPVIEPNGGAIYDDDIITITGHGTIYYTLEDIELTGNNGQKYTTPFNITTPGEVTVQAVSVTSTGVVSDVATATFNVSIAPTEYTIVFKYVSADSTADLGDNISVNDNVSEGAEYIASMSGSKVYQGTSGLKIGAAKAAGSLTINLETPVLVTDVVLNAVKYGSDTGSLKVEVKSGGETISFGTKAIDTKSTELKEYSFSTTNTIEEPVTAITLATTSKRAYVKSVTVKYRKAAPAELEVPALTGLEGLEMIEPNEEGQGMIMSQDKVTINFGEVPEGVEIHYVVRDKENTPNVSNPSLVSRKACDKADEHEGYTKHEGEDIVLDATHGSFSFFACDPANNLHSPVHTYVLDVATGVNEISVAENTEAVYFNLQGVRVANPENGTYIRVANGKAEKVMK